MNNPWISVVDKLPEQDEYVLVFDGLFQSIHIAKIDEYDDWVSDGASDLLQLTHWRPLPMTPRQEQEYLALRDSPYHAKK